MSPTQVRWGIVGLGQLAEVWVAPAIRDSTNGILEACADTQEDRLKQFCSQYNVKHKYHSYEELVNDPNVDAIYVATPNALHHPVVLAAAEAKKHVLCQKPMALTVRDAEEMISACHKSGVILRVGLQLRFSRALSAIMQIVSDGKIGEVREVTAQRLAPIHEAKGWRHNLKMAGAGAIVDVGVHVIDFVQWIIGDRIKELFAFSIPERPRHIPDETAVIMLKFYNGCITTVRCSRQLPIGANNLQLFGLKGMISTGPLRWVEKNIITLHNHEGSTEYEFPVENLYLREIEAFGMELEGKRTQMAIGEDGLLLVNVTECIMRSLDSRSAISVKNRGG